MDPDLSAKINAGEGQQRDTSGPGSNDKEAPVTAKFPWDEGSYAIPAVGVRVMRWLDQEPDGTKAWVLDGEKSVCFYVPNIVTFKPSIEEFRAAGFTVTGNSDERIFGRLEIVPPTGSTCIPANDGGVLVKDGGGIVLAEYLPWRGSEYCILSLIPAAPQNT